MQCWNCGINLDVDKISFRASCEACLADLHCCQNCKYYQLGLPNDCKIPGTEYVADRSRNNFCEEFSPKGVFIQKKRGSSTKFDDLFKQ
ncbi:MAG: hypothetical protein JSS09_04555 [Verrucomicrobia bacterium]|nr:hypothetical protein [Verrucomicrobiota bacterium]